MERSTALKIIKQFIICLMTAILLFFGKKPITEWSELDFTGHGSIVVIMILAVIFTILLWRKKPTEFSAKIFGEMNAEQILQMIQRHASGEEKILLEDGDNIFTLQKSGGSSHRVVVYKNKENNSWTMNVNVY